MKNEKNEKNKKNTSILKDVIIGTLFVIGAIVLLWIIMFIIAISEPRIKRKDKINITNFVENYLTEKYGDLNFDVTSIDQDFDSSWDKWFDYSNLEGYFVHFDCDVVESYVYLSGTNEDEYNVTSDYLVYDLYFSNADSQFEELKKIQPSEEVENQFSNVIKEFEPNFTSFYDVSIKLDVSKKYGKIPTIQELSNNISFYKVWSFRYYLEEETLDKTEYVEKLENYLYNYSNNKWECNIYSNNNVWCSEE